MTTHLSWEGGGKSLPPIFRCDIIFLVEISVVIDPNYFQIKSEKHPFPSTFYNFCSFIFVISSCHSTHAIFLYTVNINLHKIKQNNWKINHHSTPLRICHNASDQVLTYGYFKSVCIDFRSLITTRHPYISLWFRCVMICIFPHALDAHLIRSNRVKKKIFTSLIKFQATKISHFIFVNKYSSIITWNLLK